jgi:hypothetical protein
MTLKRALLPLAALILAAACSDSPGAPTAAVAPSDETSRALLDPPPPPLTGTILYGGTGDGEVDRSTDALTAANAGAGSAECPLVTFCVPGRYFLNETNNNEWLDFVSEEPLPSDVRRQLQKFGAACLSEDGIGSDVSVDQEGTLFCPVGSLAQGRIINRNGVTEGVGLAYDVSNDRLTVTTVSLDQFDLFFGKGLVCGPSERLGVTICTTPAVFGDVWTGTQNPTTGAITYTRTSRVYSPFVYASTPPVVIEPPLEVVVAP